MIEKEHTNLPSLSSEEESVKDNPLEVEETSSEEPSSLLSSAKIEDPPKMLATFLANRKRSCSSPLILCNFILERKFVREYDRKRTY